MPCPHQQCVFFTVACQLHFPACVDLNAVLFAEISRASAAARITGVGTPVVTTSTLEPRHLLLPVRKALHGPAMETLSWGSWYGGDRRRQGSPSPAHAPLTPKAHSPTQTQEGAASGSPRTRGMQTGRLPPSPSDLPSPHDTAAWKERCAPDVSNTPRFDSAAHAKHFRSRGLLEKYPV